MNINTTAELIIIAEEAAFELPDETERFQELQDQLQDSPWLNEVIEREELEDALQNTVKVSDETRTQCIAELSAGQRNNWRITQ